MKIKIKTKAKKQWSHSDRTMIKAAAEWAVDELGLWASPVPLVIILRDFECNSHGDALDLDEKCIIRLARKGNWLSTLFHELEHIRQYIEDELELEQDQAMWRGKKVLRGDYWSEPWEVEARKVEDKLFSKYRKYLLTFFE